MPNDSRLIIYVEIDEEITSVFDRIKNIQKKEILLVVPRKAILFQSVVNLKILKDKLLKKGKELVIVTTDRNGQHLANKIGLQVLNRVEVEKPEFVIEENPIVKIQPIQARRNLSPKEESPQRFTEKKISIRELIQEYRAGTLTPRTTPFLSVTLTGGVWAGMCMTLGPGDPLATGLSL